MPDASIPGRSFVTRRAIVDLVRNAALASYGVTGMGERDVAGRLLATLGLGGRGIRVHFGGRLAIEIRLTVAYGLPIAEVARQVDSAVRYAIRRAIDRDIDDLTIHVGRLRYTQPSTTPAQPAAADDPRAAGAPPTGRP